MMRRSAHTRIAAIAATMACACAATRARADEDIHFLAEHAVESGMDDRYMALPWPSRSVGAHTWQSSVDVASATTTTHFVRLDGSLVSAAAAHGITPRWGYEIMGSFGRLRLSGSLGGERLTQGYLSAVPLDLPAQANFTGTRGTETLEAAGVAAIHELAPPDSSVSAQLVFGFLLERVDVDGFEMNYRLASGADSGATGALGYDAHASFVTPFVGWQQTRPISAHWSWSPRALFLDPRPPRALTTRIAGRDFVLSTAGESSIPIGDGFATAGLAFAHRPSGLEIDVGGLLYYAVGESATHPGVTHARILHVAWRHAWR
jgi:hypothetical protein